METTQTRTADAKGRVTLSTAFANSTVIIEYVSETEVRIRKAVVVPEAELRFAEESASPLSDRDRDRFLDLLDHPPEASAALRAAVRTLKPHAELDD